MTGPTAVDSIAGRATPKTSRPPMRRLLRSIAQFAISPPVISVAIFALFLVAWELYYFNGLGTLTSSPTRKSA